MAEAAGFRGLRQAQGPHVVDREGDSEGRGFRSGGRTQGGLTLARVITAHPAKPLLYDGDRRRSVQGAGASRSLSAKGAYEKHMPVQFNDGACYPSGSRAQTSIGRELRQRALHVYPLGKDGVPGKSAATGDEGINAAHCVLVSPDNRNLYIPYEVNLALLQYNGDTGAITLWSRRMPACRKARARATWRIIQSC